MATERVVIVGAGHAGFQLGASLRQGGFDGAIVLLSDERVLPYQRPPLSKDYLDGKIGLDLLLMRPEAFYRDHRIDYLPGAPAAEIDRAARQLRLASGERLGYDHLVLATGARNRVPPLPGIELDGVSYLRNLAETDELRERLAAAEHIVVIGAGFIGLEFAAIARGKGKPVRILELTDRVMGRVVCPPTSEFFAAAHRSKGVEFSFGAQAVRIVGRNGKVDHIELADGGQLPADLVLVSIGVVPNGELAADAGLAVQNGIVVDAQLLTSDPAISAIGDCCAYPSMHAGGAMKRCRTPPTTRAPSPTASSGSRTHMPRCRGSGASRSSFGYRSPGSPPGTTTPCCAARSRVASSQCSAIATESCSASSRSTARPTTRMPAGCWRPAVR